MVFDTDSSLNENCCKIIWLMKEATDKLYVPYGLRWSMPSSGKEDVCWVDFILLLSSIICSIYAGY